MFLMKQIISRQRYLWSGAILTFISILFMAAWGRAIQHFVEKFLGKGSLVSITLVFLGLGVWLFYKYIIKSKSNRLKRLVLFTIIASVYTWRLMSLHVQVERFHLIEYGLLAILVCLATSERGQGFVSLGWGLSAAWFGGLCDEFFQWWLPARVGEWRDVVINIQSGILGLSALSLIHFHAITRGKSSRLNRMMISIVFAVLCILSGQFILKVHLFGYQNTDKNIGTFNSIYSSEQLLDATVEKYLEAVRKAGGHQTKDKITDHFLYFYEREGKEHFDRTLLLLELKNLKEAHSEYLITTKYYAPWLEGTQRGFSRETMAKLKKVRPIDPDIFQSDVMNWIWTSSSRFQVLIVSLLFGSLLLILAILYWYRIL